MSSQSDILLTFETLPKTSVLSLFRKHHGTILPVIKSTCSNVIPFDVQKYNEICHFTDQDNYLAITYPQLLAAPLHYQIVTHPQFPFPAIGLVHVEQHITSHHPIPTTAILSIHTWCDNLHQVRSGYHFSLHTEVFDSSQKLLWKGESVVLTKHLPGHKQKNASVSKEPLIYTKTQSLLVPENQGRIYAAVSKDWNLIHVHWIFAKLFGFQRAIVHGMWTMAVAIAFAKKQGVEGKSYHARFLRPVFLPSTIVFGISTSPDNLSHIHVLRKDTQKTHLEIDIKRTSPNQ